MDRVARIYCTLFEVDGHGNHWQRVCSLFCISRRTLQNILLQFEETGDVAERDARRESVEDEDKKMRGERRAPAVAPALRVDAHVGRRALGFVRSQQAHGKPTLAKDVLEHVLRPLGQGDVSLRTVQRFLRRLGLRVTIDPIEGTHGHWTEAHYVRRDRWNFISTVNEHRFGGGRVCYTDECYVWEHPTKDMLSWVDPHDPYRGEARGRRASVIAGVFDNGELILPSVKVFEQYRLQRGELTLYPHYANEAVQDESDSSASEPLSGPASASADEIDDFGDFLERYVEIVPSESAEDGQKNKRRRREALELSLDSIFLASMEYCIWCRILPLSDQTIVNELKERGFDVDEQQNVVRSVRLKLELTIEEVTVTPEDELPDYVFDVPDGPVCIFCETPLVTDSMCDWFCCRHCNVHDGAEVVGAGTFGKTYGIKFPECAGDRPGIAGEPENDGGSADQRRASIATPTATGGAPAASSSTSAAANAVRTSKSEYKPGQKTNVLHADFVTFWFEEFLLKPLAAREIQNVLFVFDLASTHLTTPDGTLWSDVTTTKHAAMQYLRSIGERVDESMRKDEVIELAKEKFSRSPTRLQELARQYGHQVIYLPTHHPGLNVIEFVWAIAKRIVARQHSKSRTFEQVINQVKNALTNDAIDREKIQNCMKDVQKEMRYYIQLETDVLQREDRKAVEIYKQRLKRWEQGHENNDGDEQIEQSRPRPPLVMPLSFRGDLNRYTQIEE